MSLFDALIDLEDRYQEIGRLLSQPEIATNPKELRRYATEHAHLESVVTAYRSYKDASEALVETQELLQDDDPEMREMAELEIGELRTQVSDLEAEIKLLLIPRDPNDDKNVVLEVRAGTGGDEAALFAADLFRMYSRYAEANRWKTEILSSNYNDLGGFKEVIALFSGEGVFAKFKYEGGVHRVQRVPSTESQGRIHTSAVTVAIMPEAEEVDVDINDGDLRIDTYRASGAGGQHVNKTESAIRITHLPTGLVVTCQDEKSQHKNRARAMKVLASRLLDQQQRAQHAEMSEARRSQVGSGDRSERIRTYNFPQNRVTDHRIGLTVYKLDIVINGDADYIFTPMIAHFQAEALKELESGGV